MCVLLCVFLVRDDIEEMVLPLVLPSLINVCCTSTGTVSFNPFPMNSASCASVDTTARPRLALGWIDLARMAFLHETLLPRSLPAVLVRLLPLGPGCSHLVKPSVAVC